jgi:hypothetical protein
MGMEGKALLQMMKNTRPFFHYYSGSGIEESGNTVFAAGVWRKRELEVAHVDGLSCLQVLLISSTEVPWPVTRPK